MVTAELSSLALDARCSEHDKGIVWSTSRTITPAEEWIPAGGGNDNGGRIEFTSAGTCCAGRGAGGRTVRCRKCLGNAKVDEQVDVEDTGLLTIVVV